MSSNPRICMDYGDGYHYTAEMGLHMTAGSIVSVCGHGLWPKLNTGPACDAQHSCSLVHRFVAALHKF